VLVVQATGAAPTLVDGLRAAGGDVVVINAYSARPVAASREVCDHALDADALLLASGSAARAWVDVFGRDAPGVIVAIGDQTASVAQQVGLKITVVAADHSVEGMLRSLNEYFSDAN
jgi:uroporphyrinogen-III synthase